MIKSVRLQNFQSHEDTYVEFQPGVNVIIGQSDSGKTAILRALRLVLENKPGGEEYRSHWGGDTRVTVELYDGTVIVRERGKGGRNAYIMNGVEYVAFGQDVPEDIKKVINMSDVNRQGQMDAPYLLSETPGAIAQHFNKVANLDVIDHATSYINKKINSITADVNHHKKNVDTYKEELERMPDIATIEKLVVRYESYEKDKERMVADKRNLVRITYRMQEVVDSLQTYKDVSGRLQHIDRILECIRDKKEKELDKSNLSKIVHRFRTNREALKTIPGNTNERLGVITTLLELYEKRKETARTRQNVQELCIHIQTAEKSRENASIRVKELEKQYKEHFPDECPLCGTLQKKK